MTTKETKFKKKMYLNLFKCILKIIIIITTVSSKYAFKFHYDIFVTS